eukprot:9452567-Heterocapsa_arctica.AAC.1
MELQKTLNIKPKHGKVNPKEHGLKNQRVLAFIDVAFEKFHKGGSQIAALVAITHDRRKQFGGLTVLPAASMGEIHEVIAGVEFIVIAIYDLTT